MKYSYIIQRLFLLLLNLLLTSFLTFILLRLTPGDPADLILKKVFASGQEYQATDEELQTVTERFKLNRPMAIQYLDWLKEAVRLDFGISYVTGLKVTDELGLRVWPTLSLALLSMALSLLLMVVTGAIYHFFRYSIIRGLIDAAIIGFIAIPNFYLALLLILVVSMQLNLLPVSGYGDWKHYILPVLTLGLTMFGYTTKILNTAVDENTKREYIVTANAKGLSCFSIFRNHLLKNSLIPVIPYVAMQLGYMLGGVVIIETIFSFPGIGKLLVDSITTMDIPVIQGCVVFIALIFSGANFLADAVVFLIDPRIRFKK